MLTLDLALLVVVVAVDGKIDTHNLLVVGIGGLVLGALALTASIWLGDCVRIVWMRFSGPGLNDPERRRVMRRLSVRGAILVVVSLVLLTAGPRLILFL